MTSDALYKDKVMLAREKKIFFKDDTDALDAWVISKNYGIKADGALVDLVNLDRFFPDTYHLKASLSITSCMILRKHLGTIDASQECMEGHGEDEKVPVTLKGGMDTLMLCSDSGFDPLLMQSYMKGERLPFIGHDCTLWRRMFQPEGSSDDRLFFRQISKMIFDKKFDEMLDFASSSTMVKY